MTGPAVDDRSQPDTPPRLQIAMVVYDDLTLLDLIGPHTVFAPLADIHLVAGSTEPVMGDTGVSITPTTSYADCPSDLDVLFVPGGRGTLAAMQDEQLLDFLRDRGATARYVTSVCTGALVLGAAGLLAGHRATTHWATHDALALFDDVKAVRQRVVIDGNRVTGGGVTAGIDFGLTLLAALRGEQAAQLSQLLLEYDPEPPYDAGSSTGAGPQLTAVAQQFFGEFNAALLEGAGRANSTPR